MPDFEKVRGTLKQGSVPGSGEKILESLEGSEASITELQDELDYSDTNIRRWVTFYHNQGILEQTRVKDIQRGNLEKFYTLSSRYREQ